MSAASKLRPRCPERGTELYGSVSPLKLIKGSLSSRKVARQSPVVAGMHRAVDGALLGLLVVVALMSALTLHWQHLWTVAFTRLETTRDLAHRLTESTALLERHLLQKTSLPKSMVPTKAANLLYLDKVNSQSRSNKNDSTGWRSLFNLIYQPTHHGY